MPQDFPTDVRAYAAAGFKGIELWLAKVEDFAQKASLQEAAHLLADHGLMAAAACAQGNLLVSEGEARQKALSDFRRKLEICAILGAPVIIVASESPTEIKPEDYDRAVVNIRQAADIASEYGVKIALEFIKGSTLVGSLSTAANIVAKADHANLGILFDTFHYHAGISKPDDIVQIPEGKLFFVHVNDCLGIPRERLSDAHRTYLGEGVLPVHDLVARLKATGYTGWYSFESFNRDIWKEDPFQVAKRIRKDMERMLS